MGGETYAVSARPQFHDEIEHRADSIRMQPHFRFLDHNPFKGVARRYFRRRKEPIQPEQQRHEFALPGRPYEVRQSATGTRTQDQPTLVPRRIRAQPEIAENMSFQRLLQCCRQTLLTREDIFIEADFVLHDAMELFAEIPQN